MRKLNQFIFWQFIQLFCFILFIVLLYYQECSVLDLIKKNANEGSVRSIYNFLYGLQFSYIHFMLWLLMWPSFLVSISLILFRRWRFYFLSLFGTITSILLIADKHYFEVFSALINVTTYKAIPFLWEIRSSVTQIINYKDMLFILSFLLFIPVGIILNRYKSSNIKDSKAHFFTDKVAGICFFIVATIAFNIGFYFDKHYVVYRMRKNRYEMIISKNPIPLSRKDAYFVPTYNTNAIDFAACFGILNYHLRDIAIFFSKKNTSLELRQDQLEHLTSWLLHKQKLNQIKSPFEGCARNRNIFILSLESFSPLTIGLKVNGIAITPTLNRMLPDALVWDSIIDQGQLGGTSDSEFSLFTSLIPDQTQISSLYLTPSYNFMTLPKELKKDGYTTISMHGYLANLWNRNINHPIYGIEKMYFKDRYSSDKSYGIAGSIPDEEFFKQSVDYLLKEKQPFIDYLITVSCHHPYKLVPQEYHNLFTPELEDGSELAGYLKLIKYVDHSLEIFFNKLKQAGLWNNSIFILMSDHMPPMTKVSKQKFDELAKIEFYSPRECRVFLCILIPGKEDLIKTYKNKYKTIVGSQYDIFPTVLHLIGKKIPLGVAGTHLFVLNQDRDAIPFQKAFTRFFIYNGILYNTLNFKDISDKDGILFTNNPSNIIKEKKIAQAKFIEVVKNNRNYQNLIKYNAQSKIIALQNKKSER